MSDLLLMASSGLPRNGLVGEFDSYREGYALTPAERLALQTVTDYSGTGHGGTKGADANAGADDPFQIKSGWAGNGSQHIAIPYQGGDKWSLEFVYTPHYPFYNYQGVIDHSASAQDWESWIYSTGVIAFRVNSATNGVLFTLPDDATFHCVFTVEKDGTNANVKLYHNGVLRDTKVQGWTDCPGNLALFCANASNTKGNGVFHYARVYSRVLGAGEVAMGYRKIKSMLAPRNVFVGVLERYKTRTTQALTDCVQGVVRGGEYWYGISNDRINKYDDSWTLLSANTQAHTDIGQSTNHLGGSAYYDGKIYAPSEAYPNDPYNNQWITVWDADTLELISKHDVSAQATEIAGLCICPNDGANGVIYAVSFVTNNTILKYDLSDFSYLGAITLTSVINQMQGIVEKDDWFYITAGADTIYRVRKDGDVLTRAVFDASAIDGEATCTEMEGPTWDERTGEMVVNIKHDDLANYAHWLEKY